MKRYPPPLDIDLRFLLKLFKGSSTKKPTVHQGLGLTGNVNLRKVLISLTAPHRSGIMIIYIRELEIFLLNTRRGVFSLE